MLTSAAAIALIDTQWRSFTGMLQLRRESAWDVPTRLPSWSIADLASHVSWGIAMEANAVAKMMASDPTPAEAVALPASTAHEAMVAAIERRTSDLLTRLEQVGGSGDERSAPMPYGPTPFPFALQIFAMEAAVHTDDLAAAFGRTDDMPTDAVDAVFTVLVGSLPVLALASKEQVSDGHGYQLVAPGVDLTVSSIDGQWIVGRKPVRTTVIEADPSTLARFAMGRLPGLPSTITVTGDGPPASSFKDYFPGP